MWYEILPNGKCKFTERYFDDMTGKDKYVSKTFDKYNNRNKKAAEQLLAKRINEKLLAQSTDNANLRFGTLVNKYLAYQLENVKFSTYRRNRDFCNSFKKKIIGSDILVNKLTSQYVKNRFDATKKSNSSKNEMLTRFKALIRWGYQNEYIDDIRYLDKLKCYKDSSAHEKVTDKYIEVAEANKLIDGMTMNHWQLLTRFLLLTGCRIGEVIALEKKSVTSEYIDIHQTYDENGKIITTPKTVEANRRIYIQTELADLLKEIRAFNILRGISSIYLFSSRRGEPISYCAYNKYLKENSIRLIGRPITPHVLRHTHASILLAKGFDIDFIARRLGHVNSKVTREIYLHIMEELKERDNNIIRDVKML